MILRSAFSPFLGRFLALGLLLATGLSHSALSAQESSEAVPGQVDFARDIAPIIEARCIKCHGPDDPKEGIELYENYLAESYIVAEDAESSDFYLYMVTDDVDSRMPPPSEGEVPISEIALVKLWIDQGAVWPDDLVLGAKADEQTDGEKETEEGVEEGAEKEPPKERGTAERFWAFQGYFHPATVHFPIALLIISAVFVVLNLVFKSGFRDAAFYCLIFGALSAPIAAAMGWSFSPTQGWGGGGSAFNPEKAVFWHRWTGVAVAVLAVVVAIIAIRAKRERKVMDLIWQLGVLVLAALVGWTGHQGGELTYGDIYEKAFSQLVPDTGIDVDKDAMNEKVRRLKEEKAAAESATETPEEAANDESTTPDEDPSPTEEEASSVEDDKQAPETPNTDEDSSS